MLYNFGDVVFLEKADGGNAGGSGFQAGAGIAERDSAESEDWDVRLARLFEYCETSGADPGSVFFIEDGGEDGEGCTVGCGLGYFC